MSTTPQDPDVPTTPDGSVPPPPPPSDVEPPVLGEPAPPAPPAAPEQPSFGAPVPPPPGAGSVPPPPGAGSVPPPAYGAPPPAGYGQPAPGYAPPAYAGAAAPLSDSDQRMWAMLGHLLPLLGLSFVPPLVIWLVFKDRGRYVEEQAKESLNFQITIAIAAVVATILTAVSFGLLFFVWFLFIVPVIFMIMAAVAANKGEPYRYPMNIRFIK